MTSNVSIVTGTSGSDDGQERTPVLQCSEHIYPNFQFIPVVFKID